MSLIPSKDFGQTNLMSTGGLERVSLVDVCDGNDFKKINLTQMLKGTGGPASHQWFIMHNHTSSQCLA